ncbi:hypothetical protein [Methylobacter sp. BlB1]|uniref:hypothetical protein n=1 Tax=Methylobacter sp. BlB1 TaxID=2785914 RepID=UPI001894F291|nr:hypothetical protein [Methylobacter sp. BlB1]MBF6648610.1 hypothetical protein [Methylobacter sp. BlB1]
MVFAEKQAQELPEIFIDDTDNCRLPAGNRRLRLESGQCRGVKVIGNFEGGITVVGKIRLHDCQSRIWLIEINSTEDNPKAGM